MVLYIFLPLARLIQMNILRPSAPARSFLLSFLSTLLVTPLFSIAMPPSMPISPKALRILPNLCRLSLTLNVPLMLFLWMSSVSLAPIGVYGFLNLAPRNGFLP